MKTWFDFMRDRLHERACLIEWTKPLVTATMDQLAVSEWSPTFERLMRNRLVIGALRYGRLHARAKPRWDRVAGARKRLNQYEASGNLECLVDVANMALLEFEEGFHPKRHWSDINEDHCCID